MAALRATMVAGDGEAPSDAATRRGGWRAAPFIIASMAGLAVAAGGSSNNLIVFLITEFNVKSIDAAQVLNFVYACSSFFPVIAAIFADSFFGCYTVISITSLFSLLGTILLLLTVTVSGLRPSNCDAAGCATASATRLQYAVLYGALALITIGAGGTQFTLATMGANQFTRPDHRSTYFNCYFLTLYMAALAATTGVVYIEDNVSWGWGFGICVAANAIGLAVFLAGSRYYANDKPQGSPFTALLRVAVASFRKRKAAVSSHTADYYYGEKAVVRKPPTDSFRSLNRAALTSEEDVILPNGSSGINPWKLCTVEQVEDLKAVIKILPLWSSGILLSTPIGVQLSLTILQALATNRHLGPHFQIPSGSMIVFAFLTTSICLIFLNHCLWPLWTKLASWNPTPLQRVGVGHLLTASSMAVSAVVESRRRGRVGMSVLWLVPQMVIVGIGEAFQFPSQMMLYYQEFPTGLKSMSTAMIAMLIGVGFYLSTAVIDLIRRVTSWLPNDIDQGRVDCVYWVLFGIGLLNFAYFLLCCWFYEYRDVDQDKDNLGDQHPNI